MKLRCQKVKDIQIHCTWLVFARHLKRSSFHTCVFAFWLIIKRIIKENSTLNTQANKQSQPHHTTQSTKLHYGYTLLWFLTASSIRSMIIPHSTWQALISSWCKWASLGWPLMHSSGGKHKCKHSETSSTAYISAQSTIVNKHKVKNTILGNACILNLSKKNSTLGDILLFFNSTSVTAIYIILSHITLKLWAG